MKRSHSPLSQLALLFSLVCFLTAVIVCDAARPGFIYTRTRGGCTSQYWSSRREAWPRMVPQAATVSKIFGSRTFERYRYDMTLAEAIGRNDINKAFEGLVRESTASLLNSYAKRENFPFLPWEVKTMFIQGLVSEHAAIIEAQRFLLANEACH